MRVSVIIPVWNGRTVIEECLQAVNANRSDWLHEVICVDNASTDDSANLIAAQYPQVLLLRQPVNLGFAGGVNVGLHAATGDLMILLNQDCVVHPGYLNALVTAVTNNPKIGIIGAQIFNEDGTVNHVGAILEQPLAYGTHQTEIQSDTLQLADYVTGALLGITRTAWQVIGDFDEGFYPAYFEETDYCYRARLHNFQVAVAPQAQAAHLFNNKEWQTNPVKHSANQHSMRYRFITKHYSLDELLNFFAVEETAVSAEIYYDQAIGRVIAARRNLHQLSETLQKRQKDLGQNTTAVHKRVLSTKFTELYQLALVQAETLASQHDVEPRFIQDADKTDTYEQLKQLQQQEYNLLTRIYFRAPNDTQPESKWHRLYRLLLLRPLSFIILRDYYLQTKLNTIHIARFDKLQKLQHITERHLTLTKRRLTLLENLHEQDHV